MGAVLMYSFYNSCTRYFYKYYKREVSIWHWEEYLWKLNLAESNQERKAVTTWPLATNHSWCWLKTSTWLLWELWTLFWKIFNDIEKYITNILENLEHEKKEEFFWQRKFSLYVEDTCICFQKYYKISHECWSNHRNARPNQLCYVPRHMFESNT